MRSRCSGGMPGPVSRHATPDRAVLGAGADRDLPAARRVAQRVRDQVRERPGELGRVARDARDRSPAPSSRARRRARAPGARRCARTRAMTSPRSRAGARARCVMARERETSRSRCATSSRRRDVLVRGLDQLARARRRARRRAASSSSTAMRSEVSGVRSSCDSVAIELLAARLLVAQVGHVLEREDEAGVRPVARAQRRRAAARSSGRARGGRARARRGSRSRSGCARKSRRPSRRRR